MGGYTNNLREACGAIVNETRPPYLSVHLFVSRTQISEPHLSILSQYDPFGRPQIRQLSPNRCQYLPTSGLQCFATMFSLYRTRIQC